MDLYTTKNQQFCGVPIRQTWGDLAVLNYFLGSGCFKDILEVGTDQGGLTYFLSLYCKRLCTLDIVDRRTEKVKKTGNIEFFERDCLKKENVDKFMHESGLVDARSKFFFIDNGNKPLEFELFAPYLNADDLIFMHDYGSEFMYKDIEATVKKHNLELQWGKSCGSMLIGFSKP